MSIKERHEQILSILNERLFITVEELSKLMFISPSSIRRDLTFLQNNGLVKRCYGGVSLPEPICGVASFTDRAQRNTKAKRLIAHKASSLLEDGQNILLDSSSSAAFMLPYIAKKKNVCVFTNNLTTAINAIELGITTQCLGGKATNGSVALSGTETYRGLSAIKTDIMFFSSQGIDELGNISDSTEEENYVRMLMLEATKKSVFLCDSEKFSKRYVYSLCNIKNIDISVFDTKFNKISIDFNFI